MKLPPRIFLTDGGAYLDGGTISLDAKTELCEPMVFRLNQYLLTGTINPGRLFCNDEIIDVRSEREGEVLSLIETASIQIEKGPRSDTDPNYIGPPLEAIEAEEAGKIAIIEEYRTILIDFVRSERYIDIAEHGVTS